MKRYRKKPVEVEARQVDGEDYDEMCRIVEWCGGRAVGGEPTDRHVIAIDTLEGTMYAEPGDWIIREPFPTADRQFYPCKPDIFEATYEEVEASKRGQPLEMSPGFLEGALLTDYSDMDS